MVERFPESRLFRTGSSRREHDGLFSNRLGVQRSVPYGDPTGDFPACEDKSFEKNSDDPYVKDIEFTAGPVKWLPSGELVLAVHCTRITESGTTRSSAKTITIAFDADHKASVKGVKDEKAKRE